jgi:hypothetical protein
MGQWITDLAAAHHMFAGKLADRHSQAIPSDDPDYGDLGPAFPAWPGPARDAILQPPKPEIAPSPQILQRMIDRDADWEAADLLRPGVEATGQLRGSRPRSPSGPGLAGEPHNARLFQRIQTARLSGQAAALAGVLFRGPLRPRGLLAAACPHHRHHRTNGPGLRPGINLTPLPADAVTAAAPTSVPVIAYRLPPCAHSLMNDSPRRPRAGLRHHRDRYHGCAAAAGWLQTRSTCRRLQSAGYPAVRAADVDPPVVIGQLLTARLPGDQDMITGNVLPPLRSFMRPSRSARTAVQQRAAWKRARTAGSHHRG